MSERRERRDSPKRQRDFPAERKSRVLFVRNVGFNTPEEKLRELFDRYGEIKKVFSQIPQRGIAFITYVCRSEG